MNFFDTVVTVLKQDDRFFTTEGELLRNAVYESAMKMDGNLLKLLYQNETTRARFFTDVDGIAVFDKVGFGWVINNRSFLPDSYTRFKNKVGLVNSNGDYISTSNDVSLVFPYKDCVLEGGQTKEDQKRSEIFYNETLAPDEVDRLLYPKVLTNIKRYSVEGVTPCTSFEDADNLIIKGNNLLSLSSLLKRYENKIKCIYIDPPYNTGSDSFGYNDKFNHSSWLTFMKNRLNIAHRLLRNDGTIAISIDNYELAYMMVLLDEIFGKQNRKNIITVRRASASGAKVINPGVVNIVDYIVLYSKDTKQWKPNRVFTTKSYDDRYNTFIENIEAPYHEWNFTTVLDAFAKELGVAKKQLKSIFKDNYEIEIENFVIKNAKKIVRLAALDDKQISAETRELKKKSKETPNAIIYQHRDGYKDYYLLNGNAILFAKDRLIEVDGYKSFSTPITDIWDDVLPNDLHNEGGVDLKKGKKTEKMISRILELCTNENDIVLDFFAGSGTTGAVAHKMNRRYIMCEQLTEHITLEVERIKNVIEGETRGVSSMYNWYGGGSFVYCELAKLNQNFVERIESTTDDTDLVSIWNDMLKSGFISCKVNPSDVDLESKDFTDLSLDDKKRFLMEMLDKNQLYVNYCDMEDETFAVSEEDKAFTNSFYGEM